MNNLKHLIPVKDHHVAISLLIRARNELDPYLGEFVCCNLSRAAETPLEAEIVQIIRGEIAHRLEGMVTVCSWLSEKTSIPLEELTRNGGKRMVAYRKRWCDSMIAELQ